MNSIKATAASVAERTAEALGTAAQSSTRIAERELLTSSQFQLRRHMGSFHLTFTEVLAAKVNEELAPPQEVRRKPVAADWQTLSLVDDHEVEERMFADRIGQMIAHECEVELRDMAVYMGGLLQIGRVDAERNPLRAETLGTALYRAIEAVTGQSENRKLLAREMGREMARAMPACYARIVADLQARGVLPLVLKVRGVEGPGNQLPGLNSAYAGLASTRSQTGEFDSPLAGGGDATSAYGGRGSQHSGMASSMPSALGGTHGSTHGATHGADTGGAGGARSRYGAPPAAPSLHSDAQLMALLRRLTAIASRPGELDLLQRHSASGGDFASGSRISHRMAIDAPPAPAAIPPRGAGLSGLMAINLIRAHREELVQASTGKLDHMVIDVVGSLFDQILSDSRVPPQMARQIARLQLPVLRVALNDASFFSSRRHPVRRFVNRIASLACAFDEFDAGPGKQFLARVRELVEEIVEGDFDQIELYTAKLAALEDFIAEQTHAEVQENGTALTLDGKESELRVQQRYMLQLQGALSALQLPPYLRDFVSQVWSQAIALAVRRDGTDSERAQRFRRAGRDLVMSVQPKGSPSLRKKFLMQLPPLMKDLNEGMRVVGWPEPAQRDFFAKLLPAHAESLKGAPPSELDYNMMAKQLEAIFHTPVPGPDVMASADPLPEVDAAVIAQRFSPEEALRVGLVQESAVNWAKQVDIDLGAQAEAAAAEEGNDAAPAVPGLDINLDLSPTEPAEPTRGPQLIDHIKLGFAYQMHLKDEWQKVRLAHVSSGRSFFVFTRGKKHQETISVTSRMLARMCETGRMRAVESAYLMERATQRARKQLAALKTPARH